MDSLTGCAAGNDPLHLGETTLLQHSVQAVDPAFDTDDYDGVDLRVVFKLLQGIQNDGLAVEGQKLLGHGFDIHPCAGTAGKNQCSIHKNTLFITK